ncbi:MAG: hypothetical protein IT460_08765 [Planctomycetes bacterium]|nr:hypothetical protein [Planctomycetota bacterium]
MRAPRDRDAAVVGRGLVTPLGADLAATWTALAAGRAAAPPVAAAAAPLLRAAVPEELESQAKFLNGSGLLAAEAVAQAAAAARLAGAGHDDGTKGFYLAEIDWGVTDFFAYRPAFDDATDGFRRPLDAEALNVATQRKLNPFYLLETLNNNAFSFVSAWHGLRGANTSVSGWSACGTAAAGLAARAVARGDAAVAVACGAGRLTSPVTRTELERLGRSLAGVVPGEGAGALVLEPLADARARGLAPAVAVLGSGGAFGAPPHHGAAVAAAVGAACEEAGLSPHALGAVWAGAADGVASGAPGRPVELRRALGEAGPGSDAAELVLAVEALARGTLPDGRPAGRSALVLSCGLDGQVEALVLGRVG